MNDYRKHRHLFIKYVNEVSEHLNYIFYEIPDRNAKNFILHENIFMASLSGMSGEEMMKKFNISENMIQYAKNRIATYAKSTPVYPRGSLIKTRLEYML